MAQILILYASTEGQTEKIAHYIADQLHERGVRVAQHDVASLPPDFALDDYDGVIIGGSIHLGKVQRPLRDFIRRHRAGLAAMPNAFFMVCMVVESKRPEAPAEVTQLMDAFIADTGWTPERKATFAGAVKYTQYGFLTKLVMKVIAKREGGSTDTSRDHEYTRWASVAAFADDFIRAFQRAA